MSKSHLRDMARELEASELQTELGSPRMALSSRIYDDESRFQDDNADFFSIENPPHLQPLNGRSHFIRCSKVNSEYARAGNIGFQASQSLAKTQDRLPYQSPFYPTRQPVHGIKQPKPIRPQYGSTLDSDLYSGVNSNAISPQNVRSAPIDSSIFTRSSTPPSKSQTSLYEDRFRYQPTQLEPVTPVRLPPRGFRNHSSSDDFEPVSSPSTIRPPLRIEPKDSSSYPKASQQKSYPSASRENPLNALLKNHQNRRNITNIDDNEELEVPYTRHADKNGVPKNKISVSHAPLMAQGIPLVPVDTLPHKYRNVFPYKVFNATQSKCFHTVFNTSSNLVLSSPTGSGKTVVMELAVCRLVETFEPGTFKIIYQAPTKALCAERKRDWEKKFNPLGLKCTELTGDTQFNQLADVKSGDLIVTTPEKWDSVTRRWSDHKKLLELVRLFLIDEVHIIKEDRGATLEVVVSRMKTIGSRVRFVALSATVPNSKDIATWLGKDSYTPNQPAHEERLGEEFRPVKLEKVVYGYQANSNDFIFDKTLDQKLYDVIQRHSQKKPVMVFCATRNICVSTAKLLAEKWSGSSGRQRPWPAPSKPFSLRDKDLQVTGKAGVAFHHAGLDPMDRNLIEKLFLEGHISIICCTSTLAVGVNLPTHLVVIKNTVSWQGGQMREYMDLEIMQMMGRAGRPQFDTTGVAVIMTKKEKKMKYEKMISGTEKLESCLQLKLLEHLNAEIGLGTITDIESAKQWLRSTFLYIRMKSNPAYYNLKVENIESELESIVEKDVSALENAGFVEYRDTKLRCLEPGDAMARYYIKFETMNNIMELKEQPKCSEILTCISEAEEFKEFRIRSGEKTVLKEINGSPSMKWPVKFDISSPAHKTNILIQFEIGCMEYPATEGFQKYRATLLQDKGLIFQHLNRLIRCIVDVKIFVRDAVGCKHALELARCIEAKVWENTPSMLLQLEGLGPIGVRKFVNNDVKTLDQLAALENHKIEMLVSRNPPYGAKLKAEVATIPRFRIFTQITKVQSNRRDPVKINFRAEIGVLNDQTPTKWHGKLLHLYFFVERSDGYLIDFRRMPIVKLSSNKDFMIQAELTEPGQRLICHVACEEIVNTIKTVELELDIQDSQFPAPKKKALMVKRPTLGSRLIPGQMTVDASGSKLLLENKPFKPPSREVSQVSKIDSDDFGDSEFERDLKELGDRGEDLVVEDTVHQSSGWTTINSTQRPRETGEISINHASDELDESQLEKEEADERSNSKQRSDGKWDCSHACKDKYTCRHLCCREGLDHRPKPRKTTNLKGDAKVQGENWTGSLAKTKPKQSKTQESQKPLTKGLPQTKSKHAIPRKRVSDLVVAANQTAIPIIDLSNEGEEESSFKGNGCNSMRKLNQLHAKCQTNKRIKLPKLNRPTTSYETGEVPRLMKKASGTSELEDLLNDDDNFPTLSEILGDSKPQAENIDGRNSEEEYGLDDDFLDIDEPEVDIFDEYKFLKKKAGKPANVQPSGMGTELSNPNLTPKRKLAEPESLEETQVDMAAFPGTLPSSPPLPALKRARLSIMSPQVTALTDLSKVQASIKSRNPETIPSPLFLSTSSGLDAPSTSEMRAQIPQLQGSNQPDRLDTNMPDMGDGENKENKIEQELLDFLGDCVIFVD